LTVDRDSVMRTARDTIEISLVFDGNPPVRRPSTNPRVIMTA
jgi:hypothetical protein